MSVYLGRSNKELCPLEAILPYLAIRGDKQGFLFQFKDGRLLTKERFVSKVRELLQQSGVEPKNYRIAGNFRGRKLSRISWI